MEGLGIRGKHVVIVEDIVDTGQTLLKVRNDVELKGAKSVVVCSLLKKRLGKGETKSEVRYCGFSIPEVFVVGYGMDLNGWYRDLRDIWVLSEEGVKHDGAYDCNDTLLEVKNDKDGQCVDTEKYLVSMSQVPKDKDGEQCLEELSQKMNKCAVGYSTITPTSPSSTLHTVAKGNEKNGVPPLQTVTKWNETNDVPTLQTVAKWIHEGTCRKILVLSGAGVSCAAGIPDFRTPGTGLYDNIQKYNLPYPEAIFNLEFFRKNPTPFASLASELWPGRIHSPTLTHSFLTLLHRKHLLLRNYTQNIDGLEILAGLPMSHVMECHGHFRTAACSHCHIPFDGCNCKEFILKHQQVPMCPHCPHGLIKPDIVFFGEPLPNRFGKLLPKDVEQADLLIVIGTSLAVTPVNAIPKMISNKCPRVLLNHELVGDFRPRKGQKNKHRRDVFEKGDCDESIKKLCGYLGWGQELLELNRSTLITQTHTSS